MLRRIKKALRKHRNFVRKFYRSEFIERIFFVVNELVEGEIKNGIKPERVVSESKLNKSKISFLFSLDNRWFFHVSFEYQRINSPIGVSTFRGGSVALHAGNLFFSHIFFRIIICSIDISSYTWRSSGIINMASLIYDISKGQ